MNEIIISPFNAEHIKAVCELEKQCFLHPWSEEAFKAELEKERCDFFVAFVDSRVAGYIGSYIIFDDCAVANVAVGKAFRRCGVGRALLKRVIQNASQAKCAQISLEVRRSNEAAISLYKDEGFETAGTRKNFYSDPNEDALIMVKGLNNEHFSN